MTKYRDRLYAAAVRWAARNGGLEEQEGRASREEFYAAIDAVIDEIGETRDVALDDAPAYQRGFFRGYPAGEQMTIGLLGMLFKGAPPSTPQERLDHAWETDRLWRDTHAPTPPSSPHPSPAAVRAPAVGRVEVARKTRGPYRLRVRGRARTG